MLQSSHIDIWFLLSYILVNVYKLTSKNIKNVFFLNCSLKKFFESKWIERSDVLTTDKNNFICNKFLHAC
jgi:hypothetical protein